MKVIIVGAGLGGVAAAACLAHDGHDVLVLERRQELSLKGGILGIRPSAVKVLYNHGLPDDAIDGANHVIGETEFCLLSTGQVVKNVDERLYQVADEGLTRLTTRPELFEILYDAAIKAGATIKLGVAVSDLGEDSTMAYVQCEDGSRASAELVLVADGIRSRLRRKILRDVDAGHCEPIITDTTLYAFNSVPAEGLSISAKNRMFDSNGPWVRMTGWLGKDTWVVNAFDKARDVIHLGLAIVEPTTQTSLWDEDGDVEYVRQFSRSRACDEVCEVLEAAERCDRWRLAYMPSLPRWSNLRSDGADGRITLLGDAAHAILPNGGAGISMTIDDIGALSELLSNHDGNASADVPSILRRWHDICKPRAERLREFAVFNLRCLQGDSSALQSRAEAWRDEVANSPDAKPSIDAHFSTVSFAKYLSGYDPIAAVRASRKQIRG